LKDYTDGFDLFIGNKKTYHPCYREKSGLFPELSSGSELSLIILLDMSSLDTIENPLAALTSSLRK